MHLLRDVCKRYNMVNSNTADPISRLIKNIDFGKEYFGNHRISCKSKCYSRCINGDDRIYDDVQRPVV